MIDYTPTPDNSHLYRETRVAYQSIPWPKEVKLINEWWLPRFETYKMDLWAKIEDLIARSHFLLASEVKKELRKILASEWLTTAQASRIQWRTWFAIKTILEMKDETSN